MLPRAILTNIFLVSHILLLFHLPKSSWNKLRNRRNLYFPYCTRYRAITTAYRSMILGNGLPKAGVRLSFLLHIFSTFYENLHHISLTRFKKLNKRRKRNILITQFTFALYQAFIFSTFSVYLWRVVWSTPVSVHFFFTGSQKNLLWVICTE